ncbi:MAG: acyl-CoA dehydrogenase family protein [Pseudomonadota bacterium]
MDFTLSEAEIEIRERAARFSDRELIPHAARFDREHALPPPVLLKLAKAGFSQMAIPKELGGSGLGPVSYSLALSEIARGCASTAVIMSVTNMVGEIIWKFGTQEQREKYLPKLGSGEFPTASFSITEPNAGSDVRAITTRATLRGDRYILKGEKVFVTSGRTSPVIVVIAVTGSGPPKEISAFIVEKNLPGLRVGKSEEKMGLLASDTVELLFDDCAVPTGALLGELGQGFKIGMTALDSGRIGIASQAIGIAEAAYRSACANFPSEHLEDLKGEIEAARWLTLRAAWLKEQGKPFTRQASTAKLFATETATRVCQQLLSLAGIEGQLNDSPLERHYRDVRVTTLYEGTSEIQKLVIARSLIKEGFQI